MNFHYSTGGDWYLSEKKRASSDGVGLMRRERGENGD